MYRHHTDRPPAAGDPGYRPLTPIGQRRAAEAAPGEYRSLNQMAFDRNRWRQRPAPVALVRPGVDRGL